jgi:cytochrome c peroxidase
MFWDERSATLEDQVLQPIQNTTEMGMTLAEVETKVSGLSYYPSHFFKKHSEQHRFHQTGSQKHWRSL